MNQMIQQLRPEAEGRIKFTNDHRSRLTPLCASDKMSGFNKKKAGALEALGRQDENFQRDK